MVGVSWDARVRSWFVCQCLILQEVRMGRKRRQKSNIFTLSASFTLIPLRGWRDRGTTDALQEHMKH